MEGEHDPDCRRGMIWSREKQDIEMQTWYQQLVALRHANPVLRRGNLTVANLAPGLVAWRRSWQGEELLVLINPGSKPVTVKLSGQWLSLLERLPTRAEVTLCAMSGKILKKVLP